VDDGADEQSQAVQQANGIMESFAAGSCGSGNTATCFTSLASVSFPKNS
jgi:type II secretory ATPase GspE/PulE/Tfp pilus assembly ATPase PilB-like protein